MNGIERIMAERQRQIGREGYGFEHDSRHDRSELARAAVVYAMPPEWRDESDILKILLGHTDTSRGPEPVWPHGWEYRPSRENRIRELEKAGALIAAEIDRLTGASR